MKLINKPQKIRNFNLRRDEKNFLFFKRKDKVGREKANQMVKNCCNYLSKGVEKLRKKKVPEKDISIWFREEYSKMVERY